MKEKLIFFCLTILSLSALSQDIEGVNLNSDWLRMNPAYAGSNGGFRTQGNFNSSRNSFNGNQFGMSSDYFLKGIKSGVAITANQIVFWDGLLKESVLNFTYSKYITLVENKLILVPALQLGVIDKKLTFDAVSYNELIDPRIDVYWPPSFPYSNKRAMDISAGLLLDWRKCFVIGFSVRHLTRPEVGSASYSRLAQKYILHASYDKVLDDRKAINFTAYLSTQNYTEEAKLQVAMVLSKHLYFGTGAGISNNFYMSSLVAGYKGNFWNASILLGSNYYHETKYASNSTQLSVSATIRDKGQRKSLTPIHAW